MNVAFNGAARWVERFDAQVRRVYDDLGADAMIAAHSSGQYQFDCSTARDGLFRTGEGRWGFLAHACVGVSADGARRPLGVLGLIPVVRHDGAPEGPEGPGTAYANEAQRWQDLVAIVDDERDPSVRLVHVIGREGDSFGLIALLHLLELAWVLRLAQDRRVLTPAGDLMRMSEALPRETFRIRRLVPAEESNGRGRGSAKSERRALADRVATLDVRAASVFVPRPREQAADVDAVPVNIVHATEPGAGKDRVRWCLATSLPVGTQAEIEAVVDAFRAHALADALLLAVRVGCAYEADGVDRLEALLHRFVDRVPQALDLIASRQTEARRRRRPTRR